MKKEIIINASKDRSRIAIVEDGELVELYVENPENVRTIGNIYLGEVQKVMPAIRAAFVDLGEKQDAFLHFSDLTENAAQLFAMAGEDVPGLEAPVLARAPQKRVADDENEPDVEETLEVESGDGESSSRPRRSSRSRRGRGRGRGRGRREEEEEQEERRRGMVIDLTSGAQKKAKRAARPSRPEPDAPDAATAADEPSRSRRSPKRSETAEADSAPEARASEAKTSTKKTSESKSSRAKSADAESPEASDSDASTSEARPRRRSRSRGRSRPTNNDASADTAEAPTQEAGAKETDTQADEPRAEASSRDDAPTSARSRSRRRGTDSPEPDTSDAADSTEPEDDADASSRKRSRRGGRRGGSSRRDDSRGDAPNEATDADSSDDDAPRAEKADSKRTGDADAAPKSARSRSRRRSRDSSPSDDGQAAEAETDDAPDATSENGASANADSKNADAKKEDPADAKPKRSKRRGPAVVDLTSSAKPKPKAKRNDDDADDESSDDTSRSRRGGRGRSKNQDADAGSDDSQKDAEADESSEDRSGRRRSSGRSRSDDDRSDSGRGRERTRDDDASDDADEDASSRSRRGRGRSKDADSSDDSGASRGRRRSRSDADDDSGDDASSSRGRRSSKGDDDAKGSRSRSSDRSRGGRGRDSGRGRSGSRGGRSSSNANQNVPPPQELLKRGSRVLVKVTKEPISSKGSRVSTDISLAGRFLVLVPAADYIAVSKKIESSKERRRLKSLAQSLKPDDCGVIVRTVAEGRDAKSLDTDLRLLIEKWDGIKAGLEGRPRPPKTLYTDVNMVSSIIRDLFSEDFDRILIDDPKVYKNVKAYVEAVAPDMAGNVQLHKSKTPVYRSAGLEKQVEEAFSRRVNMKGGGYLFIETTEAMHVVDVNSGRAGRGKSQKENLMAVNLESAREIAKQLRLRDLGGIIVVDFIDLRHESDRRKVTDELKKAFKRDRAVTKLLPMSDFGLVQITRQRLRPSITATTTDEDGQPLDAADAAAAAGASEIPQSGRRQYAEDEPAAAAAPAPEETARPVLSAEEATPAALATRVRAWLDTYRDTVDDRYRGRPVVVRVHPLLGAFLRRGFISTLTKWRLGLRGIAFRVEEDASIDPLSFDVRDEKSGRSLLSKYSA